MSYKLPEYDPRMRAGAAPVAAAGPMVNAESFGAGRGRDMMNFGRAVSQVGQSINRIADIKQERIDRAADTTNRTNAMRDYDIWEKETLKAKKGVNAVDLDKEAEAWWEKRRKEIEPNLANNRQRDMMNNWFDGMATRAVTQMRAQSFAEAEAADSNARIEENKQIATSAAGKFRYSDDDLQAGLKKIYDNIDEELKGQKPVVLEVKKREAANAFHTAVANSRAADAPASGLAYLDRKDVQEVFTPAELKGMREKFEKQADNANLFSQVQQLVGEGVSSRVILEEANRLYPDDAAKRENFVKLADDYNSRIATDAKNGRIAAQRSLWDRWQKDGYDPRKMPTEFRDDPDNWKKALQFVETMSKVDLEKTVPNLGELDKLFDKSPSEIRDWLDDKDNYLQFQGWAAGRKDEEDRIIKKSRGEQVGGRFKDYKFDEKITRNILRNNVKLSGGWFGDETKMNDAVNSVYDLFLMRMRDENNQKANPEDVYYTLMREVADNPGLLNKTSLDYRKESSAAASAEPRVESYNPTTGKTEVSIRGEDGVTRTLVKLDAVDRLAFGSLDVREAWQVPDDADPGVYNGASYQPGDRIAIGVDQRTGKPDAVVVYDRNYNVRPESFDISLAKRGEASGLRLPPAQPQPPKTPKMLEWEKENNSTFKWEKYVGRWSAMAEDVNAPGAKTMYQADAGGALIYHAGATGITDDHYFSRIPKSPVPGSDILGRIARLKAEIASLDRDPRTRKDVAADKEREVVRLEAEYDRVTGKKAKESKFYVSHD